MTPRWRAVEVSLLAPPGFQPRPSAPRYPSRYPSPVLLTPSRDKLRPGLLDMAFAILVPVSMALWSLFILGV